ncbi:MAG: LytTR family transcriptional regulator [Marinilabiliales bacterium]|nr:LytTR family transcriptional regulator [Marinilabiliales bacterium]
MIVPLGDCYRVFELDEIIYFKTVKDYSIVCTTKERELVVVRSLLKIEESLADTTFFRINNNVLINLVFVQGYDRSKTTTVKMKTGESFEISALKKPSFIDAMKGIAKHL